ncbi:putative amino acid/polyamine transporter I, cationic amino acid transporter [Lupinus albus]|uniref:Putative amino acid/polyamine transporter I, cationic amino acid transporter n=1 Tax=Lupinus albus TaxID=3870 RepID=A0A6A4PN69_LUPAL|nr:putative amino acid/polyamine transporter I, cationic amino acid transporter [Lupinus albus]
MVGDSVFKDGGINSGAQRRGCTIQANDFFPEESFKSWDNYGKAFLETPLRLKDRIVTRSKDHLEVVEMKARSHHQMRKTLNWWDIAWFGIGAVIGSGIFVLTGIEARDSAGPAVLLSYVVSGISAMLSVFCYTEFAIEIPVAGGSFAYLRVELGDFVAFIAAGNIILDYLIGNAAVSRSWTSYFATLCNQGPEDFRIIVPSMGPDYGHLDPIAIGVLIAVTILAIYSIKGSSIFNYIASILHMLVLLFIIIAGLINANPANYAPFAPFGVRGVFKASAVLFFAYIGFDAVSTMAEETKNPARDIPIGLVGSMVITTILYCVLAVTLCLMQSYKTLDIHAPFSVAFTVIGMDWAKYIVAFGALKGMTTVLLASILGQARYLTHISRTHMMPPWFSHVDEKTGTPINATIAMVVASSVIAFFTKLEILANLLSISTLFIFMLVAIALLVRRYYVSGVTTKGNQIKLIGSIVLIVGSSTGVSVNWAVDGSWIGYAICFPLWVLGTVFLWLGVPQAKKPTFWGVPLVPWLPSFSIAINAVLLGTIDKASYIRFGIWTGFLFVYYLLFGLHASYDTAKELEAKCGAEEWNKVEEGGENGVSPTPISN